MATKITEDTMTAELNGAVIAMATRTRDGWMASNWPAALTRNQAITAMTLAEHLAAGHSENDPLSIVWREELCHG